MTGILGKRWATIHKEAVKTLSYTLATFLSFAIQNYGLYAIFVMFGFTYYLIYNRPSFLHIGFTILKPGVTWL